jgi:hypothetical protein
VPRTVQQLVDTVRARGAFDTTDPVILDALNDRHQKMVARSRCYRRTINPGTGSTVANQRDYSLGSDVVELLEVSVGGIVYTRGWHTDIASSAQNWLLLDGAGGIIAPEEDSEGALEVALIPTPTDVQTLTARAALLPPDLVVGTDTTIKAPRDFHEALIAGAISALLTSNIGDFRADIAQTFEGIFVDGCHELRAQVDRRYRGSGPAQIRIQGVNA